MPQPSGGSFNQEEPDIAASSWPDSGPVEPVAGIRTGLRREIGRMTDGRRITYYTLPDPSHSKTAHPEGDE